jgi:hypothetical protein
MSHYIKLFTATVFLLCALSACKPGIYHPLGGTSGPSQKPVNIHGMASV